MKRSRTAEYRLAAAREELRQAELGESSRIAERYISGAELRDDPVASATAACNALQGEVDRLTKIETAIAGELDHLQPRMRVLRSTHAAILGDMVLQSPEYAALLAAHKAAWRHLRSIKAALRAVAAGLHGAPQQILDAPSRAEPLDEKIVGYPTDFELADQWREALAQFEVTADVELPAKV